MTENAITLRELQARFEDGKPSFISNGDLRRYRKFSQDTSRRLGSLQGWVQLYLAGKASVGELEAGLVASMLATP